VHSASHEFDYAAFLQAELPKPIVAHGVRPLALDLFAGCGGLALGFEVAGFDTIGFEMDADACTTYNENLAGRCHQIFLKPGLDLVSDRHVDIIIGGPPCQPFSVIGSQRGKQDARDGFPAFLSAMQRYQPKLAIFENVRGMLYRNQSYFHSICAEMRALGYAVSFRLMNAVDFGVPQNRERMIVVAHRKEWKFPVPDSTQAQVTVGQALADIDIPKGEPLRLLTPSMDKYVATYEAKSKCINPRDLNMQRPSRTVTCRNLSAATADMLRIKLPDGSRRMLTQREGARLQSFPDWFTFSGSESRRFEQIGNAVAPLFAKAIGKAARLALQRPDLSEIGIRQLNELDEQISLYA
jgi:DNA (cytosine-5)-methyltransferase 1